jgi:hypothetical protein
LTVLFAGRHDLALPWRVYHRAAHAQFVVASRELTHFDRPVSGTWPAAARMTALESSRPLIHSVALNGHFAAFAAGGNLRHPTGKSKPQPAPPRLVQTAATLAVARAILFTPPFGWNSPRPFLPAKNR